MLFFLWNNITYSIIVRLPRFLVFVDEYVRICLMSLDCLFSHNDPMVRPISINLGSTALISWLRWFKIRGILLDGSKRYGICSTWSCTAAVSGGEGGLILKQKGIWHSPRSIPHRWQYSKTSHAVCYLPLWTLNTPDQYCMHFRQENSVIEYSAI